MVFLFAITVHERCIYYGHLAQHTKFKHIIRFRYEILREWTEWIPRRLNGQSMQQGGGDRQRARQLVSRHGRFRRGVGTENAVALPGQI